MKNVDPPLQFGMMILLRYPEQVRRVNLRKVKALAPVLSFPGRNKLPHLRRLWYKALQCHTFHSDISCLIDSFYINTSTLLISCKAQKSYVFNSIGCPQQVTVPSPGRVTINSEPHFLHTYLLPIWLAIFILASLKYFSAILYQPLC